MEIHTLVSFIVASVLLTFAPGPDILFVATQSMAKGARAGIAGAAGLCTGLIVHIALVTTGVSVLIRQSALAFNAVRVAGVIYLLWLAIQAFRHRNDPPIQDGGNAENSAADSSENSSENSGGNAENGNAARGNDGAKLRLRKLYRTGACMSAVNPKVIVFFLAFLPQFVPAGAEHAWQYLLLLGAIFDLQAFIIMSGVSLCAGALFRTLRAKPAISKALNIITALVFACIAVSLFFV